MPGASAYPPISKPSCSLYRSSIGGVYLILEGDPPALKIKVRKPPSSHKGAVSDLALPLSELSNPFKQNILPAS